MDEHTSSMESAAAELGGRTLEWNELDFIGWKEFRRMAPAVVGLELSRVERVLADADPGSDDYNALIRARFEMRRFAERLEHASREDCEGLKEPLQRALLAVSLLADRSDAIRYVARRLRYVHDRLGLVY